MPLWLGVAAGIVFALATNPMTNSLFGLHGRWRNILVVQAVTVLVGIGSLLGGYLSLRDRERRESELRREEILIQKFEELVAQSEERVRNIESQYRTPPINLPEPQEGWRNLAQNVSTNFDLPRALDCRDMFESLLRVQLLTSDPERGFTRPPTTFAFQRHSSGGHQLPERAWQIPAKEDLGRGAVYWSLAIFVVALRENDGEWWHAQAAIDRELAFRQSLIDASDYEERLQESALLAASAAMARLQADIDGTPVWHHLNSGESACFSEPGVQLQT